jgi:hypothetical protein
MSDLHINDADILPPAEIETENAGVEIHKPKAVHGWREFANEIGVIVIGVLIALGAEQVVETFHWKHVVGEQRQSLLTEVKASLVAVASRQRQQGCIDRRLAAIRSLLERHARGQKLGIVGPFAYPTRAGATQGSWDIALAGQALSHMSEEERLKYSDAFGNLRTWEELTEREHTIWTRLSMLTDADLLTDTDWSAVRAAYTEAVEMNVSRRDFADFILTQVGQESFSYVPVPLASHGTYATLDRQICLSYIR